MQLILRLLFWIDQSPARYWAVALGAYILLFAICLWPAVASAKIFQHRFFGWLGSDAVFAGLITLVIFAFRWPFLFVPFEFNPDESSFITQALTLRHDPVFWRSISSGTSGPLNVYPLLLPWMLGFPINYLAARIIGLACIIGSVFVFYFTARRFSPLVLARLAVLPPVTFFALTIHPDFLHYSSEDVPLFLLATAIFLSLKLPESRTHLSRLAFGTGCVLGAVPFAKVQSTLIALTITAFCYLFLLNHPGESRRQKLKYCVWLTLGGLAIPVIEIVITTTFGAFPHFWQSYVLANRQYEHNGLSLLTKVGQMPILKGGPQGFDPYVEGLLLSGGLFAIGAGLVRRWAGLKWDTHSRFLALATAVLVVSWISVIAPGWPSTHYLLFLIIPVVTWAFAAASLFLAEKKSPFGPFLSLVSVLWCVLGVGWQLFNFRPHAGDRPLGLLKQNLNTPVSVAAQSILRFASPNELLGIWGPYQINAEAGMGKATRDNYFDYLPVYDGVVPDYFKDLYMADLRGANPPVFVDAITLKTYDFGDRTDSGYETFPPLADYVRNHYELADDIDGVRIFVRKDRLLEILQIHPEFRNPFLQTNLESNFKNQPDHEDGRAFTLLCLARQRLKNGRNDEAAVTYQKVLAINPRSAKAHNGLGSAFLKMGRVDDAMACFQTALEIKPEYAEAQWNLGIAFLYKGQVEEAITCYRNAINILPDFAEFHDNLGVILRKAGRNDEALDEFQKALEFQPRLVEAQRNLADALLFKGQMEEDAGRWASAAGYWNNALKIEPNSLPALNNLAWLLGTCPDAGIANSVKAVELAEWANQLSGGENPAILRTLAAAYMSAGRVADTKTTAQRALRLAEAETNSPLAELIRQEIQSYETNSSENLTTNR